MASTPKGLKNSNVEQMKSLPQHELPITRKTPAVRQGPPPTTASELCRRGYLNCEIPSDLDSLDMLMEKFGFLPGRCNCRPNPTVLELKHKYLEEVVKFYDCVGDRVLEEIFKCPVQLDAESRFVASLPPDCRRNFSAHKFPYELPEGVQHYVMWYTQEGKTLTAKKITEHIRMDIADITKKRDGFKFGWYENPKMTVLEVYHVQVFWVSDNICDDFESSVAI
eukprot:m.114058 g.114058  ORF g.114058 m.114058 type:complete len:223 (+) comp28324_c0_seq2:228-896(+)